MPKSDESEPQRTRRYTRQEKAGPPKRRSRRGFSIDPPPRKVELDEDYQIRVGIFKGDRFHEVDVTEANQDGSWLTLVWKRKTFMKIQKIFLQPEDSYYKILPISEDVTRVPEGARIEMAPGRVQQPMRAPAAALQGASENYDPSKYREQMALDLEDAAVSQKADLRYPRTPRVPPPETLIPVMPATEAMPDLPDVEQEQ